MKKDEIDEKTKIYNEGFLKGQEHQRMSPETRHAIKELEISNKDIHNLLSDIHSAVFGPLGLIAVTTKIEAHASKTNGRVSKNEYWRYMIIGALILMSAVGVPMMMRQMDRIDDLNNQVISLTSKQQ